MQNQKNLRSEVVLGSFRDPSGVVFKRNGFFYRRINPIYEENYNFFISSGLYKSLVKDKLLIPHQELNKNGSHFKIIMPETIPFISYPYEWSFSQLKNAALITLEIQKRALEFKMSLKDSSAYNIQFLKGKPILIDTLSFEKYTEGKPWVGYRQFCQHFLAPLTLMCFKDLRIQGLSRIYIDGLPIDLTSSLLPLKTYFNLSLLTHIHLHAKSQNYYANCSEKKLRLKDSRVNKRSLLAIIDSLESSVKNLKYKFKETQWGNYYSNVIYSKASFEQKKQIIKKFLTITNPKIVWDVGANTGLFSRLASELGILTLSIDSDPEAVEKNYLRSIEDKEENILPLLNDLTNPSPGIGWQNEERMSLVARGPADTILALALIHHLAILNNVPFYKIANFLRKICKFLIIEFVPKSDVNVNEMLSFREDIFPDYTLECFLSQFSKYFNVWQSVKIKGSERTLFLMKGK